MKPVTDNQKIAQLLTDVADLLEIQAANPFRIRSYRIAAEAVGAHGENVAELVGTEGALREALEIGQGLEAKIRQIVETGRSADRDALLDEVPEGLLELLRIPGLGPKTVGAIWRGLNVTSAHELRQAIEDGRFRTLPRMGAKKEASVLAALERLRKSTAS